MSAISPAGPVTIEGLGVDVDDVRSAERRAAGAWPETFHQMLGGWRIRHSPGVPNRRANSVLPLFSLDGITVEDALGQIETFYAGHGLPSRFMISPACDPENLDQILERRGYHIDAPTDVQWADVAGITNTTNKTHDVRLSGQPDRGWMDVYMEGISDDQEISRKSDLIKRISSNRILVQLMVDNEPISVGLGVYEAGWTGIFCMHTLNQYRRRGFAKTVLGALTRWGQGQGGAHMYLQVERDNPAARTFYEQCGYITRYGYHYRTKES